MVERNGHGGAGGRRRLAAARAALALWAIGAAWAGAGEARAQVGILPGIIAPLIFKKAAPVRPVGGPGAGLGGGTTIVPIDPDFQRALANARRYIGQGEFDAAAEVLQSLLSRQDAGFVAGAEPGCYGAMTQRVNEALASMGEAGLARYRLLYEAKAAAILRQAIDRGDVRLLSQVATEYLHTRSGVAALEALGDWRFDQGRFDAAGRTWQQAAAMGEDAMRPCRLGKQVVALHLAGQVARAKVLADEIAKRYPDATATLGGREWKVSEFLAWASGLSPATGQARGLTERGDWLGTGSGASEVRMSDCDVVPSPQWQVTEPAVSPAPAAAPGAGSPLAPLSPMVSTVSFIAPEVGGAIAPKAPASPAPVAADEVPLMAMRPWLQRPVGGPFVIRAARKGGHVVVRWLTREGKGLTGLEGYGLPSAQGQPLVAAIDPLIVGDLLICRRDDGVAAYDLTGSRTGECGGKVWASLPLPAPRGSNWIGSPNAWFADASGYSITSDGRRAFVVGSMPRPAQPGKLEPATELRMGRGWGGVPPTGEEEPTALVALSLEQEGKVLWTVGGGAGDGGDESLRRARFTSAPAVQAERLYAAATINDAIHLVCLDMGGTVLWKVPIAETPPGNPAIRRYRPMQEPAGASIALAEGMVFLCTNTGVLACVDAESGQAQWARQYVDGETITARSRGAYAIRPGGLGGNLNPLLVLEGKVIALPGDRQELLAVSAADGKLLWTKPAQGQTELSAIDSGRVLLSSPGLTVVDAGTGREAFHAADLGLRGRPAVGAKAVVAGGQGQLVRLDLKDYTISRTNLASPEAMLGNLVAAGGRLVAANPSGLYVYVNYADHRTELDRRLAGAQGQARGKVLLDRGKLACQAGRFDEALADLKAAFEQAGESVALGDGAREWQMRTYIARGDRREQPGEMVKDFQRAYDVAGTPARQAQMLVRLAKAQRAQAAGTPAPDEAGKLECLRQAVQAAHRLADTVGGEKVADVPVGAASASQPPELLPLTDGRAWAMATFLPALLKENGRACYGAWDAQADTALAGALAGDDVAAMLAVRDRWPNSMHVPRALIAAAGSIYRRQTAAPAADDQELDRAYGLLADVEDGADPRTAVTSLTGRAMIAARRAAASPLMWILAQQIRDICAEGKIPLTEPVAFNQVDKPLQTFLDELGGPDQASAPAPAEPALAAPLEPAFTLKGDYYLVRDQACQGVRQGAGVLAVREDRLIWLDTGASAADKAVRWDVKTPLNSREIRNYMLGAPGFSLVGALSGDGKSILVCDRTWAMALNVADGKGLWKEPVNVMALTGGAVHSMGLADGRLVVLDHAGRARCLDGADGKLLWTTDLSADLGRFGAPPQIAGGLVLLQSDGAVKVACLDLRTGKSRALWASNAYVSARVLPCGLVAVLAEGACSLYSLAGSTPMARPIWTRKKYDPALQPAIVGADRSRIFISDNMNAPTLDVIRLDNKPLPAVKLTSGQGGVCAVHPAGEFLYLAVGRNVNGARAGLYMGQMVISPMALYRVEAATGREVWKNPVPLTVGPSSASFPVVQAGQTVMATAGGPTFGTSLAVMLLGVSDGKRLQTIELAGPIQGAAGIKAQEDMARRRSLGPAQVVAGRLCAEDVGGITVYRPKDVPPPAKP